MKTRAIAVALAIGLVGTAQAQDTARSPDGHHIASIVPIGPGDENGSGAQALVVAGTKNAAARRLLVSRWNEDYARNLANLSRPLFSPDGAYVYFNTADASPNSGYVHRFDLRLNVVTAVCAGSVLRIVRTGPNRGDLLVQTHRYRDGPDGGSYNPVFLVHPSGKKIMVVPGSDDDDGELAIDPWLAKMKWRAW